jgi:hypothetical protein
MIAAVALALAYELYRRAIARVHARPSAYASATLLFALPGTVALGLFLGKNLAPLSALPCLVFGIWAEERCWRCRYEDLLRELGSEEAARAQVEAWRVQVAHDAAD